MTIDPSSWQGILLWAAVAGQGQDRRVDVGGLADGPLRFGFAITLSVPIAVLGAALTSASDPLSATYAERLGHGQALADQQMGGALMWIGAMVAGAGLVLATLWRWASHEQAIAERLERSTGSRAQVSSSGFAADRDDGIVSRR